MYQAISKSGAMLGEHESESKLRDMFRSAGFLDVRSTSFMKHPETGTVVAILNKEEWSAP